MHLPGILDKAAKRLSAKPLTPPPSMAEQAAPIPSAKDEEPASSAEQKNNQPQRAQGVQAEKSAKAGQVEIGMSTGMTDSWRTVVFRSIVRDDTLRIPSSSAEEGEQ